MLTIGATLVFLVKAQTRLKLNGQDAHWSEANGRPYFQSPNNLHRDYTFQVALYQVMNTRWVATSDVYIDHVYLHLQVCSRYARLGLLETCGKRH